MPRIPERINYTRLIRRPKSADCYVTAKARPTPLVWTRQLLKLNTAALGEPGETIDADTCIGAYIYASRGEAGRAQVRILYMRFTR